MDSNNQISSPKWQEKRLKIFQRDNFSCCNCGDKDSQLNVHHTYYEYGKKIWEYEDESLITLCCTCHKQITDIKRDIRKSIDSNFVYLDELFELNELLSVLAEFDPYNLKKIKEGLINIITKK